MVFVKPLGINRIRKRCPRPVDQERLRRSHAGNNQGRQENPCDSLHVFLSMFTIYRLGYPQVSLARVTALLQSAHLLLKLSKSLYERNLACLRLAFSASG